METLTKPKGASSSTAAAPRWVLLDRYVDNGDHSKANAKTTAASCTSSGLRFSISFTIAEPPELSSFHFDLLAGIGTMPSSDDDKNTKDLELKIVAAHHDSVLVELGVPQSSYFGQRVSFKYFLYKAGAGHKSSLFLLPGCFVPNQFKRKKYAGQQVPTRSDKPRILSCFKNTGILHGGDGEILLAQLEVGREAPYSTAELCVLRRGARDWVLKLVPIVHHEGEGVPVGHWTEIDAAVPVGTRFMCWVDYLNGCLLCDIAEEEENPKLRYVPLPISPPDMRDHYSERPDMFISWTLAAAGPDSMRLVSVAPRCCCGGPGKTSCERSSFAFNVTTWTVKLKMEEPMVWVKDGVLDCDELWQLPNYGRLPRVAPRFPILSSDDPDVICFTVCENKYFINNADKTVWMFEINTRSKALLSVVRTDMESYNVSDFLSAKLHW